MLFSSPSHGENRGSSPLGSANNVKQLVEVTLAIFQRIFNKRAAIAGSLNYP
jgi:hypothetical protein